MLSNMGEVSYPGWSGWVNSWIAKVIGLIARWSGEEERLTQNGWEWPNGRENMREEPFPTYYNNFEIVKLDTFRKPEVTSWLDEIMQDPERRKYKLTSTHIQANEKISLAAVGRRSGRSNSSGSISSGALHLTAPPPWIDAYPYEVALDMSDNPKSARRALPAPSTRTFPCVMIRPGVSSRKDHTHTM